MDKISHGLARLVLIQPIEVSVVISSSSVIITGDSWDTGSSDSWEEAGDFTSDSSHGAARRGNETRTKTHQTLPLLSTLARLHQGDYDGSGQQSCKCNYVDFSK